MISKAFLSSVSSKKPPKSLTNAGLPLKPELIQSTVLATSAETIDLAIALKTASRVSSLKVTLAVLTAIALAEIESGL